ncbi:putative MFS-type transporter YcaD [Methyloligella halotolerans]|uniref:Putative MFS-type transporter YcaD n=1 Tax=Methyloligella halotolerans TaxID=1177755 RepID=A0A1E2RVS2_9HYPH|nr:MFS transporter [Methyloligella halotolerans]ODA66311.1 putative MFS-type transporter YcaD [Methyloligella halotolerans]
MFTAILPVRTLLLAIFMLMAGTGFLSTLLSVRLEREGVSSLLIGLVATCFFAGLTLGSLRVSRVIQRVGHIRAFASFVSIFSASTLGYAIHQDVPLWAFLRFVDGFCLAGVYICLESWLNEKATMTTRGAILAGYTVALYSGQGFGQFLLNLSDRLPSLPFMAAAVILSLAVLPVALTRIPQPDITYQPRSTIRRLYSISPLGLVGATLAGMMLGAFFGLGAVYAARLGLTLTATAFFMSMVILGGVVMQWPLGWLSDRYDRRMVIVGCFTAVFFVSLGVTFVAVPDVALLLLGMMFGGTSFALYPLCASHVNDQVSLDERVGASGGLVLVYSAGSAVGPMIAAAAMSLMGAGGLFLFIAICSGAAALFGFWRSQTGEAIPEDEQGAFMTYASTTPMSATLDPEIPEDYVPADYPADAEVSR